MAEESPKRRKANFSEAETEALIALVLRHEPMLFAGGAGRATPGQRRRLWEHIRREVSPLAACPRDVEDLKKRWRDLKRRDRAKLRRLSSEMHERGPPPEEGTPSEALPTPVGANASPAPSPPAHGCIEEPSPCSQPCIAEMKLKEEIVVKIVEPDEEAAQDARAVPPSQDHFPLMEAPYFSSFGKVEGKTNFQTQADESDTSEPDPIHLQQQQIQVMQQGFESVNHNLRLLQHSMQDLSSSVRLMAHALDAIKTVYVKNNSGPLTYSNTSTQTTAGYRSPVSPTADNRSRSHATESSSRSSSCSSSSVSQERGTSEVRGHPLKNIKREHTNGCYYTLGET
ncbi:uncharacterized protein [Ambystoma mexicanum]|uniref:uncharacterized protein n=1 Tax=Ambystoma mexicanum TaxID=8296 RepID=UPI0037E92772